MRAGTWSTGASYYYSGRRFRYANIADSSVTINFAGVKISLIAKKAANYGRAKVSLDGATVVPKDL